MKSGPISFASCVEDISLRDPKPEVLVLMPVFNEEASVTKVVSEWFQEIANSTEHFVFLAIDDGSSDKTPTILESLEQKWGKRLLVYRWNNRGHGQTCIQGYRIAIAAGVPYVFQIDSDGQCDPQYFFRFWRLRMRYDVIYGNRVKRDDGWQRVVSSKTLRLLLLFFTGTNCRDSNVPYRMMKTSALANILSTISKEFFLANVAVAVLLQHAKATHAYIPIHFRERYGGEVSLKVGRFAVKAIELVRQLKALRKP
jgi:dolichol-phosphate mannosyltransferase